MEPDNRATFRNGPIFKRQGSAGTLQQRFCNKEAEAQAGRFVAGIILEMPATAGCDVGLADPGQDFRRKARPVVGDRDRNGILAPVGID